MEEQITAVRRFNRLVVQRVGALHDAKLPRERSFGLSRLLAEIAPDGTQARALRARLGMDLSDLERHLGRLEAQGLVVVDHDVHDGRLLRAVRLTPDGAAERALLERSSVQLAASVLEPLSAPQRERLIAAMAEVERLLLASLVSIDVTDPRDPDARHCVRSFFEELDARFEAGFDPEQSVSAADEEMTLPHGLLLVAAAAGSPVGCAALKFHPDTEVAEVKRMWTSPEVRGLGLGRRLLETLVREARSRRVRMLRLETNRALPEARRLYVTTGFTEVAPFSAEPYADFWLQRDLDRE